MNIEYFEGTEELLLNVKPLWEKTRDYHKDISTYFKSKFEQQNFETREAGLLEKSIGGKFRIFLAKDSEADKYIGYCVSTIDNKSTGEIDSLFVEQLYRRNGIAENLMKLALSWMEGQYVKSVNLSIAVGNETVMDFYKKFNFYPYQIVLEKKE